MISPAFMSSMLEKTRLERELLIPASGSSSVCTGHKHAATLSFSSVRCQPDDRHTALYRPAFSPSPAPTSPVAAEAGCSAAGWAASVLPASCFRLLPVSRWGCGGCSPAAPAAAAAAARSTSPCTSMKLTGKGRTRWTARLVQPAHCQISIRACDLSRFLWVCYGGGLQHAVTEAEHGTVPWHRLSGLERTPSCRCTHLNSVLLWRRLQLQLPLYGPLLKLHLLNRPCRGTSMTKHTSQDPSCSGA